MDTQGHSVDDPRATSTLREGAWETASASDREWLGGVSGALKTPQVLDATEVFSYFWDETPNETTFDMADIPQIGLPESLLPDAFPRSSLFVEAAAPAKGLAWGMLCDRDGNAGRTTMNRINTLAAKRGIATISAPGDPGVVSCDPGLVERAGAMLYVDPAPFEGGGREFYGRLAGDNELEEWAAVLQIVPFVRLDGELGRGGVEAPQVVYYVPVDHDHRVRPLGSEEDLPMIIPDVRSSGERDKSLGETLAKSHRPLIMPVLFALACAASSQTGREASASLEAAGEDAFGPVWRLRMGGLGRRLNERGGALTLGLSHALTVCREEFGDSPGPRGG